jgi:hypothetical protein
MMTVEINIAYSMCLFPKWYGMGRKEWYDLAQYR